MPDPTRDLDAALDRLAPEDAHALIVAARREAELQVIEEHLLADLAATDVDDAQRAAVVAAWDQYAADERRRVGMARLIRQRGLAPPG
jgi:hypothetical protein